MSSQRVAMNPPMLTRPSFFDDIVMMSARENISLQISLMVASLYCGSRILMKYAFSAKRAESKTTRLLYLSAILRTPRRLSIETGCPPAVLFVIVTMMKGILSAFSARHFSSLSRSTLPLKGTSSWVSFASSTVQSTAKALRLSM